MGWDGDISHMGRLAENIGRLARVPSRAAVRVAERIGELTQEQFDARTDPYGRPWREHAESTIDRWGEHPLLELSGEMRGSLDVRPMSGAGVSLTIDHPSEDHQTGWSGPQGEGPARPVLPSGPLPPEWKEAIADVVKGEIASVLR